MGRGWEEGGREGRSGVRIEEGEIGGVVGEVGGGRIVTGRSGVWRRQMGG